ncbi:MAG: twin-arginine translocation signal domain-containing protein [bacterium]|nr:twin-arginine translocation signal domain-containing protein [bacterium]
MRMKDMQLNRRAFIGTAGVGVAAMAGVSWADKTPASKPSKPYFFIQMADPQLPWGSLKSWERAIDSANALKPSFVVVCGDLLNSDGNAKKRDYKKDEKFAKDYLDTAAKLDKSIPFYNVAGNHDVCNVPTPETLEWYTKRFGKLWYTLNHAGDFFMVVESDLIKNSTGAPKAAAEQMAWIKKTLGSAEVKNARHRIVFMHHPMCLKKPDEPNQYFNLPLKLRTELLKQFARAGVRAVFSGHVHGNLYAKYGDIELVTTSSTGKMLRKDPLGFRIVKVYPDRIEHKYYGYEALPKKVKF